MSRTPPRSNSNRLTRRFDLHYCTFVQAGLAAGVSFAVFAQAAHDEWAACVLFGGVTLLSLVLLLGHYRTGRAIVLPLLGPILFVLAAFVATSRFSYDFVTSRFECWVWFFSFLSFYLLINSMQTPSKKDAFFELCPYVLLPLLISCVLQRATGQIEVHSGLINSVILSGFTLYWVPCLWERRKRSGKDRMLLGCAALILILAQSWWAWFLIASGFIYYYKEDLKIIYSKYKTPFTVLAMAVILGALAVVGLRLQLYGLHGNQHGSRLDWWLAALRMAARHPFAGVGLGGYAVAYPYFRSPGILNTLYSHNFPLQILSETGLFGTAAVVGLITAVARKVDKESPSAAKRVWLSTLVIVFCYSLVHINMEYFLNKILFLFILAPLLSRKSSDLRLAPGRWMPLAAVVLIFFVPSWLAPWKASIRYVDGMRAEEIHAWIQARVAYEEAVRIDPAYADAYAGLARADAEAYRQGGSLADLAASRAHWEHALLWKRSIRYVADLNRQVP